MTDPAMTAYTLLVPGEPTGKGRPRFARATGRAFTPAKTRLAENRIYIAWLDAGQPRLDGPLELIVLAVLERPAAHWKRDGTFSAAGQRSHWPTKRPDWDNVAKLTADALDGYGYGNDSQIVHATVTKRWANPGEDAHTRITVRAITGTGLPVLRAVA